jgi:hypothetical protein
MKINGEEFAFGYCHKTIGESYGVLAETIVDISFSKDGVGVNIVFSSDEISLFNKYFGEARVGSSLHELISETVSVNPRQKLYSHFSPQACTFRTFTTKVKQIKNRRSRNIPSRRKK